jgi:outer membrane protein W
MTGLGSGNLGIQVGFDYFSWSTESFGFGNYSWTNISIGATANYHFKLVDTKFDPFVGLGLGYENWSCDYGGSGNLCGAYSSAIYFIGRAGGRYFVSEKVALYADVGAGAATLNLGAMFRLK